MTENKFIQALQRTFSPSDRFPNPGRGETEFVRVGNDRLVYRRGRSEIRVRVRDLYESYVHFRGGRMSSSDLRSFAPSVFNSAPATGPSGHSCNCSFPFHLLGTLDLAGPIEGAGIAGDPYAVRVFGR